MDVLKNFSDELERLSKSLFDETLPPGTSQKIRATALLGLIPDANLDENIARLDKNQIWTAWIVFRDSISLANNVPLYVYKNDATFHEAVKCHSNNKFAVGNSNLVPCIPMIVGGAVAVGADTEGSIFLDSTNNRLCYISNGVRYYLPIGTAF